MLTINQIRRIAALIEDYHLGFSLRIVGAGATGASQEDIERLVALEILSRDEATRALELDAFGDSATLGILRQHAEDLVGPALANEARGAINALSWEVLRDHLKENPIPLDPRQRAAIEWATTQAGERIIQRGRAVSSQFVTAALGQHSAASTVEDMTKDATARAIEQGLSRRKLASDLGHASRNWNHDWHRVARTELQEADNRAAAMTIADTHGEDAKIARVPNPTACEDCSRLYLDEEGNPIIWSLAELSANGDNVGRKRADWQATLGTVHPNCHCRTRMVPPGFVFGPDRQLYARGTVPGEGGEGAGEGEEGGAAPAPAVAPPPASPAT